jgi:hypothetical protein
MEYLDSSSQTFDLRDSGHQGAERPRQIVVSSLIRLFLCFETKARRKDRTYLDLCARSHLRELRTERRAPSFVACVIGSGCLKFGRPGFASDGQHVTASARQPPSFLRGGPKFCGPPRPASVHLGPPLPPWPASAKNLGFAAFLFCLVPLRHENSWAGLIIYSDPVPPVCGEDGK